MRTLCLPLLLPATLFLTGCEFDPSDWGDSNRFKENFSMEHKLASGGRLSLETFNGSVELLGWDKESVEITGTKYASKEDVMKDIRFDTSSQPNSLTIRTIRPVERNCNCGASFVVRAPRKLVMDLIASSNGSIKAESFTGNARLKTSNGSIKVWNLTGDLDASTSNASIELAQFQGGATLRTSNGRIKADGVKGLFDATTSNASIDASIADPNDGSPVTARTSNGSVTLALDKFSNNPVRVTTSNSSINLRLPDSVNAQVRGSTSNGSISTDFEVTTREISKNNIDARLGSGGPVIDLHTSNGSIRLLRR